MSMRQQALDRALTDQPACVEDGDCVLMSAAVHCPNLIDLGDCGYVVHRAALERYDAQRVTESICRAVQGAEFGCSAGPSCIAQGTPRCRAGACEGIPP
jgi:hypothetical protein